MHLQKGLVYLCTKRFLLPLLHFWNYNPSPNGQIISFIGTQAHLQTQLAGAEWYKVLKIIHCRISLTEYIEEEVILQSYILSFLFFFCWRATHENGLRKGLHQSTENCWSSFQDVNLERQSLLCVYSREKTILDFFWQKSVTPRL